MVCEEYDVLSAPGLAIPVFAPSLCSPDDPVCALPNDIDDAVVFSHMKVGSLRSRLLLCAGCCVAAHSCSLDGLASGGGTTRLGARSGVS